MFEGPLHREVALASRPLFDIRRRKDRSRFALAVSGGDGHRTVLAWAEVDADFGNAPVLLATRLDGRTRTRSAASSWSPSTGAGRATSAP